LADDVDEFVLSVGRMNVRKNVETVIEAASRAREISAGRPLVVVGSSEHSGVSVDLPAATRSMVEEGSLVILGRITDGELRWLYEHARAFIFLSRDEGYGLPPVEAAHFGAPLIVSDIDVLREVTRGDAVYVSPDSAAEVATAIDNLIRESRPRPERPATGVESTTEWDAVATRLRAELCLRLEEHPSCQ